jgi:hypothetical protein
MKRLRCIINIIFATRFITILRHEKYKNRPMLRIGLKLIVIFFSVFFLCTCIDPYSPKLKGYESLLVVEGLITDENSAYTVKVSRTIQGQDAIPTKVTDALVFITDGNGNRAELTTQGNGTYITDSKSFRGAVGRNYVLHVITSDGNEYESDQCMMQPVPDIDSIYYNKDSELTNNGTDTQEGIMFYVNSKGIDNSHYYRWDYEETWKFKVPTPKRFDYINDTTILAVANVKEFGWKSNKSNEVLIHSPLSGVTDGTMNKPIHFVASAKSDRLSLQYSILIRQYSISKEEYDFWNSMEKVNNSGADIFASQPFPVISNIHNIRNSSELVLGYFQVSAVKQKRKFVSFSEIVALDMPTYHYPCERIEKEPKDYKMQFGLAPTWDDVYNMFCLNSNYYFVEPRYIPETTKLLKLVFAKPECADSEITGTSIKPDFWIDLN